MKFLLGIVLIIAALWGPFYLFTLIPENWNQMWYGFPLFMTTTIAVFVLAMMGVGTIIEAVENA